MSGCVYRPFLKDKMKSRSGIYRTPEAPAEWLGSRSPDLVGHTETSANHTAVGQEQVPSPVSGEPRARPGRNTPAPHLLLWGQQAPLSTKQSPWSHLLLSLLPKPKVGLTSRVSYGSPYPRDLEQASSGRYRGGESLPVEGLGWGDLETGSLCSMGTK